MSGGNLKYLHLVVIFLLLFLFPNLAERFVPLSTPPYAEALEISLTESRSEARTVIVSPDEKINTEVFEKIHPAVVNIATITLSMNFWLEVIPNEGQGSGFIIDREGYILTNNHVVANARKITVTMADGTKIPAFLVGRDPASDLAVLKIPPQHVVAVAVLGDSDKIRVGQKAIAIGNPFGLSHTLTTGIVSALNRGIMTDDGHQIDNLIQTDAAINPGNSGGPLLNSNGEVMGINSVIYSRSGGYQGIGFAIPSNHARYVATELIKHGRVARPWLGITGIAVSPELSEGLRLGRETGVLVIDVFRGSPAYFAGIRGGNRDVIAGGMRFRVGGDIITSIDGQNITGMKQMGRLLNKLRVDQRVVVQVFRNERLMELDVELKEKP
jgi:putative serine protease PepD